MIYFITGNKYKKSERIRKRVGRWAKKQWGGED
jgi:hypothetical protein